VKKIIHLVLTPVHYLYKVLHICNQWSLGYLIGISPLLLVLINEVQYIREGYHSIWTTLYVMTIGLICLGVVGMIIQAALTILEFLLSYADILWRKTRFSKKNHKSKNSQSRHGHIPPPSNEARSESDRILHRYERARDMLLLEDGFTKEELKKSYRTHLKMYHPDTGETDESLVLKINEAYQILKPYAK